MVEVRWEGEGLRVQRPQLCPGGPPGGNPGAGALGLGTSRWFGKQHARGTCLILLFCSRHILEEPAVPAVSLEAPGGQDIPDALQCAGVPDPEAQAQAPQLEFSPCHRLLPLQGRWASGACSLTWGLQLLSFLPISCPLHHLSLAWGQILALPLRNM